MSYDREKLLIFLKNINILYEEFSHEKLFTVEQSKKLRGKIEGRHTKNLFLKNIRDLL